MHNFPTAYQRRTLWNAITGISLLALGVLVVGLVWLATETFAYLQTVLLPLAVAGVLAYLLEPVVQWLERKKIPRLRAVVLVFVALGGLLGGLALYVLPKTYAQGMELIGNRDKVVAFVKSHTDKFLANHPEHPVRDWLTPGRNPEGHRTPTKAELWLEDNAGRIANGAWEILGRGLRGAGVFLGLLLGAFLVPIYLWFFLIESKKIQQNWESFIPLRASRFKREIVETLAEINDYLIAFFRGQMIVSLIDGCLVAVALAIFGLPYAFIIGLAVAVLGLIPYIGNLLCWLPAVLLAFIHFSVPENQHWLGPTVWHYPVAVTAIFFGIQQINSFITAPKIVGDSVGLHPMTVIFSVFFWSLLLGGALGALLAVPMTASVKVLFKRYIWEKQLKEPAAPQVPGTAPASPAS
jgi:predicted PurR-regulated permease PerM